MYALMFMCMLIVILATVLLPLIILHLMYVYIYSSDGSKLAVASSSTYQQPIPGTIPGTGAETGTGTEDDIYIHYIQEGEVKLRAKV